MDRKGMVSGIIAQKELIIAASVLAYVGVYAAIGIGGLTFQSQPGFSYLRSTSSSVQAGQVWIEGSDLHWTDGSTEHWIAKKADLWVAYHFAAGSGSTAQDSSGNNYDGTLDGNAGWASGRFGTTVSLDGSGDEVAIQGLSHTTVGGISEMTVCAWIKTTDGDATIASYDRSEYWRFAIGQCGASSGQLAFCTTDAQSRTHDMAGGSTINDGNWHHVCASFDSSDTYDKKIWIDGSLARQLDVEETGNNLGDGTTRYGYVGAGSESASFNADNYGDFNGQIDEFRYYSRELSADAIRALYNGDGTEPAGGAGPPGSIWIEGDFIHWIDQNGIERAYVGAKTGTSSGPAGSIWIENGLIHYIDQSGQERVINQ